MNVNWSLFFWVVWHVHKNVVSNFLFCFMTFFMHWNWRNSWFLAEPHREEETQAVVWATSLQQIYDWFMLHQTSHSREEIRSSDKEQGRAKSCDLCCFRATFAVLMWSCYISWQHCHHVSLFTLFSHISSNKLSWRVFCQSSCTPEQICFL